MQEIQTGRAASGEPAASGAPAGLATLSAAAPIARYSEPNDFTDTEQLS